LIIFLSRAESLRQGSIPSSEDLDQWSQIFSLLFQRLSAPGVLPSLFPSTRAKAKLPFGPGYYLSGAFGAATLADATKVSSKNYRNIDIEDEPVWNLMAAIAVACTMEQQQTLVAELREKILENVMSAKEWANRKRARLEDELGAAGFEVSQQQLPGADIGPDARIRNVNLLVSLCSFT
jgi:DNA topoisomerase 2-associated protein PAT1